MKRLLPFLSFALIMTACNQAPQAPAQNSPYNQAQQQLQSNDDTAGLAQYKMWKMQNELANVNEQEQPVQTVATATPKKAVATAKKRSINVQQAPTVRRSAPAVKAPVKTSKPSSTSTESTSSTSSSAGTGQGSGEGSGTGTAAGTGAGTETAAKPAAKEGMSKATKGAIIGGTAGAAAGAVISKKNRVAGAVIGAVIGAGGGYVIGKKMEKKTQEIN